MSGKVNDNYIFGLDIGTRSVVGIVGYKVGSQFKVEAYAMIEHDTRAMIDGQIHDVAKVTETIIAVKKDLEQQLGLSLHKVCIAAAGRVLKTVLIHVEQVVDSTISIDQDRINALELLGMERAHQQVNSHLSDVEMGYHCVGYTVSKYYLNKYEISSLKGHNGKKIGADVLATFLPQEVVESLYMVINQAGMDVYSLTLEPIAAINVAIPEQFRLLNIALIDIGAGTSDIAITKAGSIIAYGMIPKAGDELTESIVHKYLVDFNTAEKIKIKASGTSKKIVFKDVIGIKHSLQKEAILEVLETSKLQLATELAQGIKELNNGKSTNAIFIVGGGGQVTSFTETLSEAIGLPKNRVVLRGKEVLSTVDFGAIKVKKGPELVTPIGICLTGLENNKHDFLQVFLNDEPIKIYDNNHLSIMDLAAYKGINPRKLIAKKGKSLIFKVNNKKKVIHGEPGIPAKILINHDEASLTSPIGMNDYVTIVSAKKGQDGHLTTHQLVKELDFEVYVDQKAYPLMPEIYVNNHLMAMNYVIKTEDEIELKLPLLTDFLQQNELEDMGYDFLLNGQETTLKTELNNLDHISRRKKDTHIDHTVVDTTQEDGKSITVMINNESIQLKGKPFYVFVDIFDYYQFDLSKPQGMVVCKINHELASYMAPIQHMDVLEVYWDRKK